jgi:hypothetical protein
MAIVPYTPVPLTPARARVESGRLAPRNQGLPVPTQAGTPAPQSAPLIPSPRATLTPGVAAALGPLMAFVARSGVPMPVSAPDPLGPVSPGGRLIKGKMEIAMTGGSEPGGVGIAPFAGPGSWSDDRMPFHRAHFIPVALPGIQSLGLGSLGPGGFAGVPEPKRQWDGAQAVKPQDGAPPGFSDELAAFRLPMSMGVPQRAYDLPGATGLTGGPYAVGSGGVLPPAGTDPYGSLPEFLQAPLSGGPAGMSGAP